MDTASELGNAPLSFGNGSASAPNRAVIVDDGFTVSVSVNEATPFVVPATLVSATNRVSFRNRETALGFLVHVTYLDNVMIDQETSGPDDGDGDGVLDEDDFCSETVAPEENVPSRRLGTNRWALGEDDEGNFVFVTTRPKGKGPNRSYTTEDTAGCSCEQIIDALDLGSGHTKFGCSISAMDDFVQLMANRQ